MRYVEQRLLELGVAPAHTESIEVRTLPTEKTCTRCKKVKPVSEYSQHKFGAGGLQSRCKSCLNAKSKEYTRRDREARAARPRPDHCECCGAFNRSGRALHWDHDHKLGGFRGWLCHYCNHALGAVKDNTEHLQLLIEYLKRGGGPPRPMVR